MGTAARTEVHGKEPTCGRSRVLHRLHNGTGLHRHHTGDVVQLLNGLHSFQRNHDVATGTGDTVYQAAQSAPGHHTLVVRVADAHHR